MKVIVISGRPATGKSTLAHMLSRKYGYPIVSKDDIKEGLAANDHGVHWYHWSKFESQAWQDLYVTIAKSPKEQPLIVEANFTPSAIKELKRILPPNSEIHEIFCYASGLTPFRRLLSRNQSGERAKVHFDRMFYPTMFLENVVAILGFDHYKPVQTTSLIRLNTTHPKDIDYQKIYQFIESVTK